jgi:REP element-mobilizing transposase RayT
MREPGRRALPHDPPLSIGVGGQVFFLTICAAERRGSPLLQGDTPGRLLEAVRHRHKRGLWFSKLWLVMPDHVHALVRLPPEGSLRHAVSDWKRWTATSAGVQWQRDFFDHRLRGDESEREKADYILQNPVRAGLVERAEDWPWEWIGE